jgi:hypothetical protein
VDEFLKQLAQRLQVPDAEVISADDVAEWPDGKLDELLAQGILTEIEPAKGVVCDQCEENCFIEPSLRTLPDNNKTIGIFVCTRNPDIGRIEVDLDRLKQWKIDKRKISQLGYGTKTKERSNKQSREIKKQNEKLQMHAALLKHHGFDSENLNNEPATQKQLQELTQWNQPKVHRVMKAIFGNQPMYVYKQKCKQEAIIGFLKKNDDVGYTLEAIYHPNEK